MGRSNTDQELLEAVEAYRACNNQEAAAEALGIAQSTLSERLKRAAERGLMLDEPPAMPGYRIKSVAGKVGDKWIKQTKEPGEEFEAPAGFSPGRITVLTEDGREVIKWQRWEKDKLDPLQIAEWLKATFADWRPAAKPVPAPKAKGDELLTILPCNDWHMNMLVWGKETDGVNWNLDIAEKVIGQGVENTLARSIPSSTCVVLGGGDLLHADNKENKTSKSGNVLDVDSRYQRGVSVTGKLMVRTINAALRRHQNVVVRILPGNHDEHTSVAITYFLLAWYRNEPRVTVDTDPSLFWWYRFGACMFGATHGHTVKIKNMASIMAHRRAEDWGATKFRYVHGFHLHHEEKLGTEGNGCISEIHQAPIPQDAWHFGSGFLSGRSLKAITYHRDYGEIDRVRTAILDAK